MSWHDGAREVTREQVFDQTPISIGRGINNSCVLTDATKVVSSAHAEIRQYPNGWVLCDVRSTNGTRLNGARITPNVEQPLHNGDRIVIGPYQLVFQAPPSPATSDVPQEDISSVRQPSEAAAIDAERLRYLLERAYGEGETSSVTQQEHQLQTVFRHAIEGYDEHRANTAIRALHTALGRRTKQAGNGSQKMAVEQPREKPIRAVISDVPSASGVVPQRSRGVSQQSDEPFTRFQLMVKAIAAGLADMVRARRAFQKEFEVKTTRLWGKKLNPIKHADSAQEIEAVLLDPTVADLSDEQLAACLTEVFHDVSIHHLGLMAGFDESIRGLLKELDPDGIATAASLETTGKGIGFFHTRELRTEAAAWRHYVQKHREFTEQEVKVFEHLLAPYFTKGYLAFHHAHKQP